jgi:hypothetical protein
MTLRIASGWQTVLTDLALILFMVTAAVVNEAPSKGKEARVSPPPSIGTPVATYRADRGAPSLRQWLHDQARDPRLRLTIVAYYPDSEQNEAMIATAALARDAAAAGFAPRVIVEPGQARPLQASLAYDR